MSGYVKPSLKRSIQRFALLRHRLTKVAFFKTKLFIFLLKESFFYENHEAQNYYEIILILRIILPYSRNFFANLTGASSFIVFEHQN